MQEQQREVTGGAIVFDAAQWPQVDNHWFAPDYWRERAALHLQAGGRGGVAVIASPAGECVLRHYRRGGLVARVLGDRYLWRGADRTRPFTEFRLLMEIARRGLPGPLPVAARYLRSGVFYRADLLTRRIADACTLAQCQAEGRLDHALAAAVGELVARFHREGIWHADLNAHNVLVAPSGLHLIDFDRGCVRGVDVTWQRSNLQRLRRSLLKLGAAGLDEAMFDAAVWVPLQQAYQRTLRA